MGKKGRIIVWVVTAGALALLHACGPSKADRDDENKKWSELQAMMKDLYKLWHECDAERTVYVKARGASLEALRMAVKTGNMATHRALEAEENKALMYVTACLKRQADYVEEGNDEASSWTSIATRKARTGRLVKASDAWLDACVKCGKAQDCIARYREATRLKDEQQKDYDRPPVCQ